MSLSMLQAFAIPLTQNALQVPPTSCHDMNAKAEDLLQRCQFETQWR